MSEYIAWDNEALERMFRLGECKLYTQDAFGERNGSVTMVMGAGSYISYTFRKGGVSKGYTLSSFHFLQYDRVNDGINMIPKDTRLPTIKLTTPALKNLALCWFYTQGKVWIDAINTKFPLDGIETSDFKVTIPRKPDGKRLIMVEKFETPTSDVAAVMRCRLRRKFDMPLAIELTKRILMARRAQLRTPLGVATLGEIYRVGCPIIDIPHEEYYNNRLEKEYLERYRVNIDTRQPLNFYRELFRFSNREMRKLKDVVTA